MSSMTVTSVRASDIRACTAGLLRFAIPGELDALLADPLTVDAHTSYGTPNRAVIEALIRRPGRERLKDALFGSEKVHPALLDPASCLLGRLLDLDDPVINSLLFESGISRNLRRQLAHQTSRRDGVTPVPFPPGVREHLRKPDLPGRLRTALLFAADPDTAGHALRSLGRGADPHGAAWACRTLLLAGRTGE
ncbi:hypothetical protein ABZ297_31010, partial [Nonomuraea sp. NPDC005983]|uniref:hypothetical protein n=1 Tax=Nonomuraea sp. NPDC005983 TaxID=3155595 RepID=UPI0033B7AE76